MAQEGTFLKPTNPDVTEDCRTITEMLGQVGEKWTMRVVGSLGERPLRFTELRKKIGGISQKMLTSTLRDLERDGFISRTVFATIPPKVEYALTELGCDLFVPVKALMEWSIDNQPRINAARARFDGPNAADAKKPAPGNGYAVGRPGV